MAVLVAGLLLGIWRGSIAVDQLQRYQPLYGGEVAVSGVVADDPGYNAERRQTEFHANGLIINNQTLPGRVLVSSYEKTSVARGDQVRATGVLKPSKGTSRQGVVGSAKVAVLVQNKSWLEDVRQRFFAAVRQALPEPHASLGLGYLVGLRADIPKELEDQLATVGLTHIIAVSGYNLTIIVQAVRRLFGKRSAYQSVVFSGLLLAGFLLVTGGSAPIIRASVVCSFSLLGWYYGRTLKPVLLLLLSGAITAFASPLYIWGDPGWYLSFLAFGGVLILAPLIVRRYFKKAPGTTAQILIETLCAQACTIPYTLYLFGGVSVIAPLANVLVLPLIPLLMLAVFIIGLLGAVLPSVAVYAGFIPSSLLTLQLWIVEKLSSVPGAHAEVTISATLMILLFVALVLFTAMLHQHAARNQKQEPNLEYDMV